MRFLREILTTFLVTLGVCLAFGASAVEPKEGRDFELVQPPLATDKAAIEVVEFFWYGCPYCFDFEPVLDAWLKKLPADVRFRRVPAILIDPRSLPSARLYYTLETMKLADKLHSAVFDAIHVDRQRLYDEKSIFKWVAAKGIDEKKFHKAWSSAGVKNSVRRADELTRAAGVMAVPSVLVDGRYVALGMGNYTELMAIIDQLIARVRAERTRAEPRKK